METRNSKKPGIGDRISHLPDSILHHIFSFIDMEFAVRSAVLSQRWRYLWCSLPTLNFEFSEIWKCNQIRYMNFIDRVFIHRDESHIKRLRLRLHLGEESLPDKLYSWVLASVRRGVQELHLEVSIDSLSFYLPLCVFTSEKLTDRNLDLASISPLQLPKSITLALPRLKKLLIAAEFSNTNLITDISKCPLLETLDICRCQRLQDEVSDTIHISNPSLKHLKLHIYDTDITKFRIYAPSLLSFSFTSMWGMDTECWAGSFPSLVSAEIELDGGVDTTACTMSKCSKQMISLLRGACNIESLTLSAWFIQIVSEVLSSPNVLELSNLRYMHLRAWPTSARICAIMYLLGISPNIETLSLECFDTSYLTRYWMEDNESSVNSAKFGEIGKGMLHLKYVYIRHVNGYPNELKFLEILLENSIVLEKIVISFGHISPDKQIRFREELLSLPRASSNVTILIQ